MKAYKVLRRLSNGELYSWVVSCFSKYGIVYEKGKWIKPKIGAIFCYKNLPSTEDITLFSNAEIWEVEIKPSKYKLKGVIHPLDADDEFKKYWKSKVKDGAYCLPEGTILADKIKLIRRIL